MALIQDAPDPFLGANIMEFDVDVELPQASTDPKSIQAAVTRLMESAVQHYEENLEPDQVEATNYYFGREFGDEVEGRSKVVSRDVMEVTESHLAQLMTTFTGPDRVVEFTGRGLEDADAAQQMTDAVEYVLYQKNAGFVTLYSAFKDALVRRLGWVKWGVDEVKRVTEERHTNLTQEAFYFLVEQFDGKPGHSVEVAGTRTDPEMGEMLIEAVIRREVTAQHPWIMAIPPEEIVYSPDAKDLESSYIVAHARYVPRDELIGMGIEAKILDKALTNGRTRGSTRGNSLGDARQYHYGGSGSNNSYETGRANPEDFEGDPSQRPVYFAEAYGYFDGDGDEIGELRKFWCVGDGYIIVNGDQDGEGNYLGEIIDDVPMAYFTPRIEPHTIAGPSNWDFLKDIQRIKSQVERGTLNSLAEAIEPKTEVVMGEVNLKDLTNPEVSGIVRVRRPGMMREIAHTFVGGETIPVLQYYNEVRENRMGVSKAAAGLDPDSLQSSTRAAVAATVSGAQQHVGLIARVFAETGMKRMFRGLAKLIADTMAPGTLIRLRSGKYVPIDPRTWDLTMDLTVNVALGLSAPEEKMIKLGALLEKQEMYLQQGVPFVKFHHLRATLNRAIDALGYRNSEEFFDRWGPEEQAQYEQMQAQQEPPPDLNAMVLEIEKMKLQMQTIAEQNQKDVEIFKAQLQDERERDKMAQDAVLKEREIEARYAVDVQDIELKRQIAERKRGQEDA